MPTVSTAEIFDRGAYLEEGFNPNTLTSTHLRGLLFYHQVDAPSNASKSKLVDVFKSQILSNLSSLREERLARLNAVPSSEDIVDVAVKPIKKRRTKVCPKY
jgi:hypothetical protein